MSLILSPTNKSILRLHINLALFLLISNLIPRLGVFGFLDLDDENVTKRNLGLYGMSCHSLLLNKSHYFSNFSDILFALHWVKREFPAAFGADPNRITIIGNSAGGTAVIHLCSSPLVSSNDFHQAVIMSKLNAF